MTGLPKSFDLLDVAVKAGAIRALQNRAVAKREEAASGITNGGEKYPNVRVTASEAAAALRISADLSSIADELEAEMPR